jgi:phosphoribosylformylglycinamidine synthase
MNFGNPERPEIMGQFVGAIEGMREACNALDFPVVSGNVSLYNETNGQAILPTPTIGAVGLLDDYTTAVGIGLKTSGETLVLIGDTAGHLGQSLYIREIHGREDGGTPPVDPTTERKNGDVVRNAIQAGLVSACHDLSDGGLLIGVTEMAMAGDLGAKIDMSNGDIAAHAWLFGDQARYVVSTSKPETILAMAAEAGVSASTLGTTGGDKISLSSGESMSVSELKSTNEDWLPSYMG